MHNDPSCEFGVEISAHTTGDLLPVSSLIRLRVLPVLWNPLSITSHQPILNFNP